MPQMKPMYWISLLIYFLASYILTLILTHYNSYKIKLTTYPSFHSLPSKMLTITKKWNFKW